MLKNAYFLAKIGADTAENERNFAKNWQLPYGSVRGAPARLREALEELALLQGLLEPATPLSLGSRGSNGKVVFWLFFLHACLFCLPAYDDGNDQILFCDPTVKKIDPKIGVDTTTNEPSKFGPQGRMQSYANSL